jgi:acyl-CoA synthetase (AMP-forming)/AMP-acid ligase II
VYSTVVIKTTTMTSCDLLLDRLEQNASKFGTKTAITYLASGPNGGKVEKQLTYSELVQQTNDLAVRLVEAGLSCGDRAVLVYPPSHEYMIAFLACLKAGIIAVPVFPPNPARRDTLVMFSKIVEGCDAKYALTSASYNHLKAISGIRDTVSRLKRPTAAWPESLNWMVTNDGTKPKSIPTVTTLKPTADQLAFLQYTSGSTSAPKGVMITHGNLAHNLTIITNELKALDDTVVVSWLPQYHDMGLIGSYLGVLYCGGSGYYMSPLSYLQRPMLWIEAISKYRATHLQAPNFAYKLTARKFNASSYASNQLDLSSVRHAINAAEPVTEDSIQAFENTFGKFGFGNVMFPTYGLAEHTVFVCSGGTQRISLSKHELEVNRTVVLKEDSGSSEDVSRLVGCGFPSHQNVDVRIVDRETSTELTEDKVGEIWVRSASKAAGYYNKPEETKEDFHGHLKGADTGDDGYLQTGDLGFMHNKELFICGRLKDLIIVGGRNYYPQDIEGTAEASSELLRPGCAAAFTIDPTQQDGEEVALILELKEVPRDSKAVCEPIIDAVRGAINQEHSLGISHIVLLKPKTVPKTTSGKIARAWCRKAFIDNSLEVVYRKSFKEGATSFEIESSAPAKVLNENDIENLRALSKEEILNKLRADVAKMGSVSPANISVDQALATILDSLTLSQFKGLLETGYAVKLSDEYLFRESTSLTKLVEVVKLGYAPDDGDTGAAAAPVVSTQGQGGIAGALGCPPGVVCCVVM